MKKSALLVIPLAWCLTEEIHAQYLFSEGFNSEATANVRQNLSRGANMEVRFLDYSSFTVGTNSFAVPEAPRSSGLGADGTRGVLMRSTYTGTSRIANLLASSGPGGAPLLFSGDYRMKFDMWLSLDPSATTSSSGTTEVGLFGIGADNVEVLGRSYRSSGKGSWGWLSTDGGFGNTLNNGDAAFRSNGVQVAILENPTQGAMWEAAWPGNPDIPGGVVNAPWNSWTTVELEAIGGTVRVLFNGIEFFSGNNMPTSGFAVLGYEDPFTSSTSFSPDHSWALFDNFTIELVPEPSIFGLSVVGGLMLMAFRRRR